jgi:hypothetical protein
MPAVVGVPEISPVVVFTVNPGGRLLAPQRVIGLWFAVIWYENGTPTVPVAFPLVMLGAAANAVVAKLMARVQPIVIAASRRFVIITLDDVFIRVAFLLGGYLGGTSGGLGEIIGKRLASAVADALQC